MKVKLLNNIYLLKGQSIFVIVLSVISFGSALAQGELRSVQGNLELQRISAQHHNKSRLKAAPIDTVELPFIDDFSSTTIFPNRKYWADSSVYINSYMAKNMLSVGVATLDNINSEGYIYKNASATPYRADSLTSNPINLNFPGRQDIWLSFLFQPGTMDEPGPEDFIFLEFYSPQTQKWDSVWSSPGFSSSVFKHQIVPINKPEYLLKGFRFRFRNLATVNGSVPGKLGIGDPWHLDYIRLDTGRHKNDTIIRDVAFTRPLSSFLRSYQSIPWKHFQKAYVNELRNKTDVTFRNNDSILRYVFSKNFIFKELTTSLKESFSIGGDSISSGVSFNLQADYTNPFTSNTKDTTVYEITCYLETDNYDLKSNDTIRFHQVFGNYFAYDDGSSESGYGFYNGGKFACQYNAYVTDTLRSIEIYFNPTLNNVTSNYSFKLAVWADNKGIPGEKLYLSKSELHPDETKMNQFDTYWLDSIIVVSDKFYIGWEQSDEGFLNIGYDLNTDSRQFLFYNTTGNWLKPGNILPPGSLMIRPSFKKYNKAVNIHGIVNVQDIHIYPNPAQNYITVSNNKNLKIEKVLIFNSLGQLIRSFPAPVSETLDISNLKAGIYIIKIISGNGAAQTVKLIKEI